MKLTLVFGLLAALHISSQESKPAPKASSPGAAIFQERCSRCHGRDGHSDTFIGHLWKIPDLHSDAVQHLSIAERIKIITEGKNQMPAHGKKLTAEEIRQVESYVREFGDKKAASSPAPDSKTH